MRRMWNALALLFRRWKYMEEGLAIPSVAGVPPADREPHRTRRAIERGERQLADYRRNGCPALARECEASLRALRTHLAALEL